jgi:hypothetical protein
MALLLGDVDIVDGGEVDSIANQRAESNNDNALKSQLKRPRGNLIQVDRNT